MPTLRTLKPRPPTEERLDDQIEESFPASDPPSLGRKERAGAPPGRSKAQPSNAETVKTPKDRGSKS
jgi:hypothetical protein